MDRICAEAARPSLARARQVVGECLGLEFPRVREEDLLTALATAAAALSFGSVEGLLDRLAAAAWDSPEWGLVAHLVTVRETSFFRSPASFDALADHVLQPLIAARRRQGFRLLSLWSAGCASGEEAYSLAILLDRLLPDREEWLIRILATDIDPEALAATRAAKYRTWSLRGVTTALRDRYFTQKGELFEVVPAIRRMVTIAPCNLAAPFDRGTIGDSGSMDLIICRNVLMYLLPESRRAAVSRLIGMLCPGGWLMTSPAEASAELFDPLRPAILGDTILFRAPEPPPPRPPEPGSFDIVREPAPAEPVLPEAPVIPPTRIADPLAKVEALANRGLIAEARRACEAALGEHRLSAALHRLHATICEELHDFDAAIAALRSVIFLEPENAAAYFALGCLLRRKGDRAGAQRFLRVSARLGAKAADRRLHAAAQARLAGIAIEKPGSPR